MRPQPQIRVIAYSADAATDVRISDPNDIKQYLHRSPVTWVNVDGIGDAKVIKAWARSSTSIASRWKTSRTSASGPNSMSSPSTSTSSRACSSASMTGSTPIN